MQQKRPWEPVRWLGFRRTGDYWAAFDDYEPDNRERLMCKIKSSRANLSFDDAELSFLQAWLTFGIVEAYCQISLSDQILLTLSENEGVILHIGSLQSVLVELAQRIRNGVVDKRQWLQAATSSLNSFKTVLESFRTHGPINGEIDVLPSNLLSLVLQIAESLGAAIFEIAEQSAEPNADLPKFARQFLHWTRFSFSVTRDYESFFLSEGTCPRALACIQRLSLVSAYAYAKEKGSDTIRRGHDRCERNICRLMSANEGSYGSIHTSSDCKCLCVKPPMDSVFEILDRGGIPVFKFVAAVKETGEALQVSSAETEEYYAISHVWAQGLGSVTEVGLPVCQLERLRQAVGERFFWIDALGVPQDKTRRKEAIIRMSDTYARARRVVVLDDSIRQHLASRSFPDQLFHVYISDWLSRLWTLPEALLAQYLTFSMGDGEVSLLEMLGPAFREPVRSPLLAALCQNLSYLIPQLGGIAFDETQTLPLRVLSSQLESRSTSKSIDETIAIARLAGAKVEPLLDLDQNGRMIDLLKQVQQLPTDIIFGRIRRIERAGYGWVPLSLMQPQRLVGPSDAIFTESGLLAEYNMLVFERRSFKDRTVCNAEIDDFDLWMRISLLREGEIEADETVLTCDALLLRGQILNVDGSCSATGVRFGSGAQESDAEEVIHCVFQSAGFTVMWGTNTQSKASNSTTLRTRLSRQRILLT